MEMEDDIAEWRLTWWQELFFWFFERSWLIERGHK